MRPVGVVVDFVVAQDLAEMFVEGADNLCVLLIFVEQPSGAITPSDPEFLKIDHVVRPRARRRGLIGAGGARCPRTHAAAASDAPGSR